MGTTNFPVLSLDDFEEGAHPSIEMLNWQAETIAMTHAMVSEMYLIFEKLKPLVDAMPSMPMGMMLPPMGGMPTGR